MIAATKMPLPVADNQFSTKTAGSARGDGTTGGTRLIRLWRPGTGMRTTEMLSSAAFICGSPQTNTRTLRMIHGIQARTIC